MISLMPEEEAKLVVPRKKQKRAGKGWSGDTQTEAELEMAETEMHTSWNNLKVDPKDTKIRKAVRRACKKEQGNGGAVMPAAPERFLPTSEIDGGGGNEEGGVPGVFAMRMGD